MWLPRAGPSGQSAREEWIEHQVSPGETFEDIARYYEVSPVQLPQWNGGVTTLVPDMKLKVRTTRPPRPPLVEEYYTVGEGEDWLAVANLYNSTEDKLRQFNPKAPDRLKGGEELLLWIERRSVRGEDAEPRRPADLHRPRGRELGRRRDQRDARQSGAAAAVAAGRRPLRLARLRDQLPR